MASKAPSTDLVPQEFRTIAAVCAATDITIGGKPTTGIDDVHKLHAGLQVGRDFTTWIEGRIEKYGFIDGVDYELIDPPKRGNQTGRGGDRRSKIYRCTLHMAKELAMVENNDVGRLVRRYYIWIEERSFAMSAPAALPGAAVRETRSIFKDLFSIAKEVYPDRNQALLAASKGTRKFTGIDPLEMVDGVHLVAPQQRPLINPTKIGAELGSISAKNVNLLLEHRDFQLKGPSGEWELKEKGKPYGVYTDTNKRHSNGRPIRQLLWSSEIVDVLKAEIAAGGHARS